MMATATMMLAALLIPATFYHTLVLILLITHYVWMEIGAMGQKHAMPCLDAKQVLLQTVMMASAVLQIHAAKELLEITLEAAFLILLDVHARQMPSAMTITHALMIDAKQI